LFHARFKFSLPWIFVVVIQVQGRRRRQDRDGFFSDVYRGTWRNRTVAIKVLAECTPHELFIKGRNLEGV
jgi:hypothetical protein